MKDFRKVSFLTSADRLRGLPVDSGAEVAFAGRSNSGKSSAINAITSRKGLARASRTPGRTQLINFFVFDDGTRLVDLPGYGFARVPEAIRRHWGKLIGEYLAGRDSLKGVFVIMDVRHPMTDFDQQLLNWCAQAGLPCHVLLTKSDKLSRGAAMQVLFRVRKQLEDLSGDLFTVQLFSATKAMGWDDARTRLARWLDPGGLEDESVAAH